RLTVKAMKQQTPSPRRSDRKVCRASHALFEALEDRRMFSAISWTGMGDGTNWSDRLNWSAARVPELTDDVTIAMPRNVSLNSNSSIRSLTLSQSAHLIVSNVNMFTFTNASAINSGATLELINSNVKANGSLPSDRTITASNNGHFVSRLCSVDNA